MEILTELSELVCILVLVGMCARMTWYICFRE